MTRAIRYRDQPLLMMRFSRERQDINRYLFEARIEYIYFLCLPLFSMKGYLLPACDATSVKLTSHKGVSGGMSRIIFLRKDAFTRTSVNL